jgi:putative endonuclease
LDQSAPAYWAYVLQNPDGRFYIGSTADLTARLDQHNAADDGSKFTHKHGPWVLVWSEPHETRAAAVQRERQIKGMKSARWIREHLLNGGASPGAPGQTVRV